MSAPAPAPAAPLQFAVAVFPDLSGFTLNVERHDVGTLASRIAAVEVVGAVGDEAAKKRLPLLSGCGFGQHRSDKVKKLH